MSRGRWLRGGGRGGLWWGGQGGGLGGERLAVAAVVEVCAPPELRTIAVGLLLPGAVTVVEVSDGEAVEVEALSWCEAVSEVCAPPELLTVLAGAELLVEVVEPVALVPDWPVVGLGGAGVGVGGRRDEDVEVDESVSVGSAHATPGVLATAAPTPSAAANSPTRPMYSA